MIVRARTEIDEGLILKLLKEKNNSTYIIPHSCYLFNSGSAALRFFLRSLGRGKKVGVQVFTCSTVHEAILSEGCVPVYMDIDSNYFTTTIDIVKNKINEIDVLLLTHLFGIPNPDYIEIKNLCIEHKVVLIDDLCQTFHAKVGERFIEELSDNYIYSFFYDKPISLLSGGLLKVSDSIDNIISKSYYLLSQNKEETGRNNLKILLLMHRLLDPKFYTKEFRNGKAWILLLQLWPINGSVAKLNKLVTSKWIRILNKLIWRNPKPSIYRLSDVETAYLFSMMNKFHDNNNILYAFLKMNNLPIPVYLENHGIVCSIAKRAILGHFIKSSDMELGLYNWPNLICDKSLYDNYPQAYKVTQTHINIPCWTEEIVRK